MLLGGIVGKRLLRPTRIARVAPVVARVAIAAAAVDEQRALYSRSRPVALERAHVIGQALATQAWIVEHDHRARWGGIVAEDRQHGVGRIALEAIAALGPFLQKQIVANVTDNALRAVREEHGHRRDIL